MNAEYFKDKTAAVDVSDWIIQGAKSSSRSPSAHLENVLFRTCGLARMGAKTVAGIEGPPHPKRDLVMERMEAIDVPYSNNM